MKQNKPLFLALAILCTLNLLGHLVCLPFLPEQVPIHWNFAGEIDGWGPKWSAAAFGRAATWNPAAARRIALY